MIRKHFMSDLHLGHNKEFIYKKRGFNSIEDHDRFIIENFGKYSLNNPSFNTYYLTGDICFKPNTTIDKYLPRLLGNKIISLGNHDYNSKLFNYGKIYSICEVHLTEGINIILTHIPIHPSELDTERWAGYFNVHGHIHDDSSYLGKRYFNLTPESRMIYESREDALIPMPEQKLVDFLKKRK